ncbi:MAG: ECF transporter S component [Oscillospiraceae bacterium]|nr:ECF transporter S component [Oscillospiraceae bacterium]
MNFTTKKLVTLALLSTIAYIVAYYFSILGIFVFISAPFLTLDPKDVIIVMGGFLYGPLAALMMSAVVSLVEMFTVSRTGFIGFIMNMLASCAFCCTAALIYKYKKSFSGAVIGLAVGCVCMTVVMLIWNFLLTPIYTGMPREAVVVMLIPVIFPFNLIKGGMNAALAVALYNPFKIVFLKAKLY